MGIQIQLVHTIRLRVLEEKEEVQESTDHHRLPKLHYGTNAQGTLVHPLLHFEINLAGI